MMPTPPVLSPTSLALLLVACGMTFLGSAQVLAHDIAQVRVAHPITARVVVMTNAGDWRVKFAKCEKPLGSDSIRIRHSDYSAGK